MPATTHATPPLPGLSPIEGKPIIARFDGGAHAAIVGTLAAAWTRPRFPNFIRWQAAAGAAVESFLRDEMDDRDLAANLATLWRQHATPLPT